MNSSRTATTWSGAAAAIAARPSSVTAGRNPRRSSSQGSFVDADNFKVTGDLTIKGVNWNAALDAGGVLVRRR